MRSYRKKLYITTIIISMLIIVNYIYYNTSVIGNLKIYILVEDENITAPPKWVMKKHSLLSGRIVFPSTIMLRGNDKALNVENWTMISNCYGPYIPSNIEAGNFMIEGVMREVYGYGFSFYLLDGENYRLWMLNLPYNALVRRENVLNCSFKLPIEKKQMEEGFYFILCSNVNATILSSVNMTWIEEASIYDRSARLTAYTPFIFTDIENFLITGNVTAVDGQRFNFYVFDVYNYDNWAILNKSYKAFFEVKNVTNTSFTFTLTKSEAISSLTWNNMLLPLYFVVENLNEHSITVKLSVEAKWIEKHKIFT